MTDYGKDSDRQRSQEAGFDYHLVKPVDVQKLEGLWQQLQSKHVRRSEKNQIRVRLFIKRAGKALSKTPQKINLATRPLRLQVRYGLK
jgi:DNA-binding response OmpR family regulator